MSAASRRQQRRHQVQRPLRDEQAADAAEEREQARFAEQLRISCPRPAPIDSRTAISPARAAPRASSRLAMFAQAISSTNAGDAEQQRQRRLRFAATRCSGRGVPARAGSASP